jgi:hypothetical protein
MGMIWRDLEGDCIEMDGAIARVPRPPVQSLNLFLKTRAWNNENLFFFIVNALRDCNADRIVNLLKFFQ